MIMKKLSYTTILAAACLLLPGCSDDAADKGLVSPDVLVADSEVEIKLSSNSSSMATRAGVYNGQTFSTPTSCVLDGRTIAIPKLALFCLATGKQDNATGATDIDWTKAKGTYNDVKLYNDPAKVWDGEISLDATEYYPVSNWYTYSFYGYYTKQGNESIVVPTPTSNRIDVNVAITGYNDIIWGESNVPANVPEGISKYAYSAKYYRECVKGGVETTPAQMTFQHMLTSFEFKVTPKDVNAQGVKITSIKLKNQLSSGTLCVASLGDGDGAGKIVTNEDVSKVDFTLYDPSVKKDDGAKTLVETLSPATFTITEDMAIGEAITLGGESDPAAFYVMPDQEKYTVEVVMSKNGKTFTAEMDIPLGDGTNSTVNPGAGKKGIITLAIYGPQEISLQATLTPWEEVELPELPEFEL